MSSVTGSEITLTQEEEGVFEAKQIEQDFDLPYSEEGNIEELDWKFGPVSVLGRIDKDSQGLNAAVSIMGIHLGNVHGPISKGVQVNFTLHQAFGGVKFYLKRNCEVWVHLDVKVKFNGFYESDFKILTLDYE